MADEYERTYHADADIEALDAYGTERGLIYRCRRCGNAWKVGGGRWRLGPCLRPAASPMRTTTTMRRW